MECDFIYIDDIVQFFLWIVDDVLEWGCYEVYNIGGFFFVKLMDMIFIFECVFGFEVVKEMLFMQLGDVMCIYVNVDKLVCDYNYCVKFDFEIGLVLFVYWFKIWFKMGVEVQGLIMWVLVVGGVGYIGFYVCCVFVVCGDELIVFDNFCSGYCYVVKWGELVEGDICNLVDIVCVLFFYVLDVVMYFVVNIEVGSGEIQLLEFWDNNVGGVINLLKEMQVVNCCMFVFFLICVIYGVLDIVLMMEDEL